MKRRTAGRAHKPRLCAYCKGPISEHRPVFLVATTAGTIVGPYHAGCATKISMEARRKHERQPRGFESAEQFGMLPREETLPW